MSRTATATQPPTATAPPVPRERIAMRAYERWVGRGCPAGTDVQDWIEAEAELKAEVAKTGRVVEQRAGSTVAKPSGGWVSPTGQRY